MNLSLEKVRDLRYGENPHQKAAWYTSGPRASATGLGAAGILQGKELSYTNLLDLDAAARIVLEFDEPAAAVIKHTNPCGAAIGVSAADAYVRAREADSSPRSAASSRSTGRSMWRRPKRLCSTFIEAVIVRRGRPRSAGDSRRRRPICGWWWPTSTALRSGRLGRYRMRFSAACSRRSAISSPKRATWMPIVCRRAKGGDQAAADR
ncbi:MAG: hypothetical protein QM736_02260 [Vicinamibacterales bacterium]